MWRALLLMVMLAGARGLAAGETLVEQPSALPAIVYCTQEYARRVVVDLGVPAAGVTVRTTPEKRFAITIRALDERRVEIRLRALGRGHGTLELLAADQVVLQRCQVQEVAISTNALSFIGVVDQRPDGATVLAAHLVLMPYVPGLDVRFICLSPDVTVADGLGERWMASETFTPTLSTGNATTSIRMVRAPGAQWTPFTYILYQTGEQISAP